MALGLNSESIEAVPPPHSGSTKSITSSPRITEKPRTTTSTAAEYIEACARSNEKASSYDPLTTLFQAEKLASRPNEDTFVDHNRCQRPTSSALRARLSSIKQAEIENTIYQTSIFRLNAKVAGGAFIAEAGNFAAVTCWEPMFAPPPPSENTSRPVFDKITNGHVTGKGASMPFPERPLFSDFCTQIEHIRREHLYPVLWNAYQLKTEFRILDEWTQKALQMAPKANRNLLFWHLCLTSRNPSVQPPVPGVVRAVIEPFVKRWVDEAGMPAVWLEAGSPRARDVYAYLGFRVVGEVTIGQEDGGDGVKTWCMMYTRA